MDFQTYARGIFGALDNYMTQHLSDTKETISSWNEWGWLDDVYRPIYEAHRDMMEASSNEEFLIALEWASHLNHASGTIIRDYCYLEHAETVLNKLEQNGLDATFPHWQTEIEEVLGKLRGSPAIMHPDTLLDYISPKCVYCGSGDLPEDKEGEPLNLTCFTCADLIALYGTCITCEHGIGLYGELCFDCATEYMEVLC